MKDRLPKIPTVVFVLGLVTVCPALEIGSVIVSLNNEGSAPLHEIEVLPGETFSVDVNLITDYTLFWVDFEIEASTSGVFSVEQLTDSEPWDSRGIQPVLGGLNPRSGSQTTVVPSPTYFGPGSTTLGTLLIRSDVDSAWGTYSLAVVDPSYMPNRVNPAQVSANPGDSFIVHLVPEPASAVLLVVGAVMSRLVRSQKEEQL